MEKPSEAILDTNFLLSIVRLKIRAFEEMREMGFKKFYLPESVMEEMEKLSKNKSIEREAEVAKEIIKKEGIVKIKGKGNVDDFLVEKSREFAIATNDSALRKRIKSFGGKSIYIRNKAFLEAD